MPRLYIAHGSLRDKCDSSHGWTQINTDGEKMKEFGDGEESAAICRASRSWTRGTLHGAAPAFLISIAIVCACAWLGAQVSTRATPQTAELRGQTLTGIDVSVWPLSSAVCGVARVETWAPSQAHAHTIAMLIKKAGARPEGCPFFKDLEPRR